MSAYQVTEFYFVLQARFQCIFKVVALTSGLQYSDPLYYYSNMAAFYSYLFFSRKTASMSLRQVSPYSRCATMRFPLVLCQPGWLWLLRPRPVSVLQIFWPSFHNVRYVYKLFLANSAVLTLHNSLVSFPDCPQTRECLLIQHLPAPT
jgi:hypothetical protein